MTCDYVYVTLWFHCTISTPPQGELLHILSLVFFPTDYTFTECTTYQTWICTVDSPVNTQITLQCGMCEKSCAGFLEWTHEQVKSFLLILSPSVVCMPVVPLKYLPFSFLLPSRTQRTEECFCSDRACLWCLPWILKSLYLRLVAAGRDAPGKLHILRLLCTIWTIQGWGRSHRLAMDSLCRWLLASGLPMLRKRDMWSTHSVPLLLLTRPPTPHYQATTVLFESFVGVLLKQTHKSWLILYTLLQVH